MWKEKEKKEDEETHTLNPVKKEKKNGQKLRLKFDSRSLHVVLFTKMSLSYELWKQKTQLFSVSKTHNSKIRKLSDKNRVMVVPNGLLVMGPTIFKLWVMKTEMSYGNWWTKHPLSFSVFPKKFLLGIYNEFETLFVSAH